MFTLRQFLVDRLKRAGIHHVFGVPGDFNLNLCEEISGDPAVQWVGCCNELNAAYAADGYARRVGLACLLVTGGVGELPALGGIAGSAAEGVPVIFISGQAPSDKRGIHHQCHYTDPFAAVKACRAICTQSFVLDRDGDVMEFAKRLDTKLFEGSAYEIRRLRGPVYVSVPSQMFVRDTGLSAVAGEKSWFTLTVPKECHQLAEFVEVKLAAAKKPLVVVGLQVHGSRIERQLTEWLAALMPRVTVAAAPMCFGPVAKPIGIPLMTLVKNGQMAEFDFVLGVGWCRNELASAWFQVNAPDVELSRDQPHTESAGWDWRDVVLCLYRRLSPPALALEWQTPEPLHLENPRRISLPVVKDILENALRPGDVVVSDTGRVCFDLMGLTVPPGVGLVTCSNYAAIGHAVGAALGALLGQVVRDKEWAAVVKGEKDEASRIIVFVGDGAFQMGLQEVATIAKWARRVEKTVICCVFNNGGYLVERNIMDTDEYNDIVDMRYTKLARALGVASSHRVTTSRELARSLEHVANRRECHFLEIVLDKYECLELAACETMGQNVRQINGLQYYPGHRPAREAGTSKKRTTGSAAKQKRGSGRRRRRGPRRHRSGDRAECDCPQKSPTKDAD